MIGKLIFKLIKPKKKKKMIPKDLLKSLGGMNLKDGELNQVFPSFEINPNF